MKTRGILFGVVRVAICIASFLTVLAATSNRASGACALEPQRSTNTVGQSRTITATVTTNGRPAAGVFVSFIIVSGPNAGANGVSSTDTNGQTSFIYAGSAGTNILQANGSVGGSTFSCLATQIWRTAATPPTITCPGPIVTNAATDSCSRTVAFEARASGGGGIPTVVCRAGGETVSQSGHSFPAGTTTVTCVASNANGTSSCSFTVTVNEGEPPSITCPADVVFPVSPGETSATVEFEAPSASDNCSDATVVCDPPSGSTFALGATTVTCTATDASGNTNNCFFTVFVEEAQPEAHDLAVTRIKAPKFVNLNSRAPIQTKRVVVTIQNRSPHTETISDLDQLNRLVTLTVQSLDPAICVDLVPVLLERPPQRRLPVNLKPKQKLNVYYEVTFDCAVNPSKGVGQQDFRYTAQVFHDAIEGISDTHPECDVCPREPLEGGVDPNPNGRIKDKGCGAPRGDGTFGNEVLTDVSVR